MNFRNNLKSLSLLIINNNTLNTIVFKLGLFSYNL